VGEASQTEHELNRPWCKHTTHGKNSVSHSVAVRMWDQLPSDFIIPGDRFSEDHFANGAYEKEHAGMGRSHLRILLDAQRARHCMVRGFGSRVDSVKWMRTIAMGFATWKSAASARQLLLGTLLRAAFQVANSRRWCHTLALPPSASVPSTFGKQGPLPKELCGRTFAEQIKLMHAVKRWMVNVAIDQTIVQSELEWVDARMRITQLRSAVRRWSLLAPKDANIVISLDDGTVQCDAIGTAAVTESAQVQPSTREAATQTTLAWLWRSEKESGGKKHWLAAQLETIKMQTLSKLFAVETRDVGSQLNPVAPTFASACIQTDTEPVYGHLALTRRRGTAAENKVVVYRQMCPEEKAREGMRVANLRIASHRAEMKARQARERYENYAEDNQTHISWAYTERAGDLEAKERRHKHNRMKASASRYTLDGRRVSSASSLKPAVAVGGGQLSLQNSASTSSIRQPLTPLSEFPAAVRTQLEHRGVGSASAVPSTPATPRQSVTTATMTSSDVSLEPLLAASAVPSQEQQPAVTMASREGRLEPLSAATAPGATVTTQDPQQSAPLDEEPLSSNLQAIAAVASAITASLELEQISLAANLARSGSPRRLGSTGHRSPTDTKGKAATLS